MYSGTECILWEGFTDQAGYGRLGSSMAHIMVYERHYGKVPFGLEIHHLCGTRNCVNHLHFKAVTHLENMSFTRKDVCIRGHSLVEPNLYFPPHRPGQRECLECKRHHKREARRRRRELQS